MVAGEFRGMAVFVEQLRHGLDADHRAIIQGQQVLTQVQLSIMFALVAQAKFRLRARQLETRLAVAVRTAGATAQVTAELQCLRGAR